MNSIATDPRLLQALRSAAARKISSAQLHDQKVDYIVGCLSDEGTSVTRLQVEKELKKLEGSEA